MPSTKSSKKQPDLLKLAQELASQPRQAANNLPILVKSLAKSDVDVSIVSLIVITRSLSPIVEAVSQSITSLHLLPLSSSSTIFFPPSILSQRCTIIQHLKLYFIGCFTRHELGSSSITTETEAIYSQWLQRHYDAYIATLFDTLQNQSGSSNNSNDAASPSSSLDSRLQVACLNALMEAVRSQMPGQLDNQMYSKLVAVLVRYHHGETVLGTLIQQYLKYADVTYFTLKALVKVCLSLASGNKRKMLDDGDNVNIYNVYDILSHIPPPTATAAQDEDDELESWCGAAEIGAVIAANDATGSRQRRRAKKKNDGDGDDDTNITKERAKWASKKHQVKAFSDAWLTFLRFPLPSTLYRKILGTLQDTILPGLVNPLLLADFLTHSLDRGGLEGILALHGIFILVTKHGLEYPKFYERLYGLLTIEALKNRHRVRFFRLTDVFLASGLVPAYTAAAFAKRFARLALQASPAGALLSLAFIHNIIRRHPACMQMLHRKPNIDNGPGGPVDKQQGGTTAVYNGIDVYDAHQTDPATSRAIESSLWEITALRRHAHPSVAAACGALDKDLSDKRKTAEVDIAELLDGSYAAMFRKEVGRRMKAVPTAFYREPPSTLFESGVEDFAGWSE